MTCNQATTCSYLARTEGPIWRCEEFDDSGPAAAVADVFVPGAGEETARHDPPGREEGLQGLCRNCDNRSTCRLPGAEMGVWFCEEYA